MRNWWVLVRLALLIAAAVAAIRMLPVSAQTGKVLKIYNGISHEMAGMFGTCQLKVVLDDGRMIGFQTTPLGEEAPFTGKMSPVPALNINLQTETGSRNENLLVRFHPPTDSDPLPEPYEYEFWSKSRQAPTHIYCKDLQPDSVGPYELQK